MFQSFTKRYIITFNSETVGMFYEWELHYNSSLNELKDKEALLGKYAYIATVKNGSPIYIQDKATHDSTPIKHGISTLLKDWKNDGTWIGTVIELIKLF